MSTTFPIGPDWRTLGTALVGAAVLITPARAQTHTFMGANGQALDGQIESVEDVDIIVRRVDGKVYALDLATLSAVDRAYVQQWKTQAAQTKDAVATAESNLDVNVIVQHADDTKDLRPGMYTPQVSVRNGEKLENFRGLQGTLVLVGEAVERPGRFKVLAVEKFHGDADAGRDFHYTGAAWPEAAAPAYRYAGYMLVLQNAAGAVIQFRRSAQFFKTAADALTLKVDAVFLLRSPLGTLRVRTKTPPPGANWPSAKSVLPLHLPPAGSAPSQPGKQS